MATYTTNLNLKKPAASENYNILDWNNNSDTIDAAYGTLNSQLNQTSAAVTYSSLDNIPVFSDGYIKLTGSASPISPDEAYGTYICFGSSNRKTILFSTTGGQIFQAYYGSSGWSNWYRLAIQS